MAQLDADADAGVIAPVKRPGVLTALLLLATTIGSASAMRTVFSPVQEVAAADLNFNDFQMSLLQGLAISIPIGLLAIPVGRMTDRGNRANLLFGLAMLWTIGTALSVFATEFWQIFAARMLAGIGAFSSLTVAISLTADLSSPSTRGRSLILLSLGNMVGGAAAFAFGGALLGYYAHAAPLIEGLSPWRNVLLVFAGASLILSLLLLTLREPARREISESSPALSVALRELWERRGLLAPLFLGQVTVVMADAAASIWAAPVLERHYNLTPEQFGGWMGLVILGSGVIGALVGGFAADFGHKSKIKGGILIGAVVAAALSIPGAFFPLMPDANGFAWLLLLLLTCGAITGLVTAAAIAVLVPNEIRGVCLGAFIVVGAIIGFGAAPTMVTLIGDAIGGQDALRYGLAYCGAATSIAATLGFATALIKAR
ncbi:MAG: MFS transporter [Hyphomonadaceae bacterium JAD_PAG50586_4]|nr:MAG: MFS transporter [Hyphomonadaceae bacterium JAD_PAG50586_4]